MNKRMWFVLASSIVLMGCTMGEIQNQTTQYVPVQQGSPDLTGLNTIQETTKSMPEATGMPSPTPMLDGRPITTPLSTPVIKPVNRVRLTTSKGVITIELYPQETPQTVRNFLSKMATGEYVGRVFHRVEDWVIQGGDPLGNGTGGGELPTELSSRLFEVGSVGVARGGDINISNDSQFFICTADCAWLTGKYTNFGKVVAGLDIAKKVAVGDTILGVEPDDSKTR